MKLLWVGDAGVPSGFAVATHKTLDVLRKTFDVTVLGINYRGDPHDYPYPIYACSPGGDAMGVGRLVWMCDRVKPDVIVLQNDPWNIGLYLKQLSRVPEHQHIPVVASVAVDGKNCRVEGLEGLAVSVFWTTFGLREAEKGGLTGPRGVIPLGVDLKEFATEDRDEARRKMHLPDRLRDAFIAGNVNRNQPRKRWDLTIEYFAEWVKTGRIEDAYLYLHVAPTGDTGCDVQQLARYYGVQERLIVRTPPTWYGESVDNMCSTYNMFDVCLSTTQGEGMGLPAMEAMACGVPCLLPDWAAYGDWAKGAALLIPCTTTAVGPPYVNVIGGVMDRTMCIRELDKLYRSRSFRAEVGLRGQERVGQARFRWEHIGAEWARVLCQVLEDARG